MFSVDSALYNMALSSLELVNNASTLVHLPNGDKVIFRLHQCFLIEIRCNPMISSWN